ncbi:PQQ-binding-like beta-propeller repeat protein, partial [Actinomadura adrarensis]
GAHSDYQALPAPKALVHGDHLIAVAGAPGDLLRVGTKNGSRIVKTGRIAAYSLTGGHRVWTSEFNGDPIGLVPDGDSVVVLSDRQQLVRVDANTGEKLLDEGLPRNLYQPAHLWVEQGRYVVVARNGGWDEEYRPVRVYTLDPNAR